MEEVVQDSNEGQTLAAEGTNCDSEKLPKGTVVKFTGLGSDAKREDIKEMLEKEFQVNIDKNSGDIAFVSYLTGKPQAMVRFKTENYGVELMKKLEKAEKIVIKGKEVTASILEGEEEESFLANALTDHKNSRKKIDFFHSADQHVSIQARYYFHYYDIFFTDLDPTFLNADQDLIFKH